MIKKGSGIVMLPFEANLTTIYYEGNFYGAVNLESYEERIKCAAGRAYHKYPTVASCGVLDENLDQFDIVGSCNEKYCITFRHDSTQLINEWIST